MKHNYITMDIDLVSSNYDESGNIAVTTKEVAFPINIGYDQPEKLASLIAYACNSHRSYLYAVQASKEAGKKERNSDIINRLGEAQEQAEKYTASLSEEERVGINLLAYVIDNKTHSTYNHKGERVMRVPEGGVDVLASFRDYTQGRIKLHELKSIILAFSDSLNRIPYLKNRTMKITDEEVQELVNMYTGNSQRRRMNRQGINAQRITKDKLIEQIILIELKKIFQFQEIVTVKKKIIEVATF